MRKKKRGMSVKVLLLRFLLEFTPAMLLSRGRNDIGEIITPRLQASTPL
jgi:hypothetical protein